MNALFNRNCFDVRGCTLYTTHFPCNECAKMVVQSGIGQVVYLQDKHPKDAPYVASRLLFTKAKIPFRQHIPEVKKIVIDFENLAAIRFQMVRYPLSFESEPIRARLFDDVTTNPAKKKQTDLRSA
ncbi:deoxycytidylate deaminase [Ixodes scapularis]|uniref:deoxycytidylate deaminase n=1 Tax=Ixodes scapularis TaxID=6945 RepID=UPI001C37F291|nr:deoxycytidylate deaminase [Ixodes scapularis]